MAIYAQTTLIITRTFANKEGDVDGEGTYGVAFNPDEVIAVVEVGGAELETLTAGVDAEFEQTGNVTEGEYILAYTPPEGAGKYRVRVQGSWTRASGQAGYSAEEVQFTVG